MWRFKNRTERRDEAIGWLEEARDGLDSVLSELDDGVGDEIIFGEKCESSGLASSDSRIRIAMDLVEQAKITVALLVFLINGDREQKLKELLTMVYSILDDAIIPESRPDIEQIINDLQQAMEYLKSCEFPNQLTANGKI